MSAAARATNVFLATGVVRRATIGGFWSLLFLRFVTDLDFEPIELVLLGTVFELTILAAEIPTGVVADVYSRKWSVIVSYLMIGPAVVVAAFAEPFWALALVHVAMGVGATFESGAETAWITDELGSSAAAEPLLLRRAQWQLVAGVVGLLGFGTLGALTTLSTALAGVGLVATSWGIALMVLMPETGFTRSEHEGWAAFVETLRAGARTCRRVPALWLLVVGVAIGGFAKEVIDRLDIQRLVDVGLPDDIDEVLLIAIIAALRSAAGIVVLMVVRRRVVGPGVVCGLSTIIAPTALGVALLAQVDVLALAAFGLVLHGGTWAASEPVVAAWANTFANNRERATVHSFVGQAEAFGEIGGGIVLGVVAQAAGVPTAMSISAALFATSALTYFRAGRHWPAPGAASTAD